MFATLRHNATIIYQNDVASQDRGSMLWRNQAGPAADWIRHGPPDGPWFGFTDDSGVEPVPFFTNLFIMAIPKTHSQPYIDTANEALHPLGLVASGVRLRGAMPLPTHILTYTTPYILSKNKSQENGTRGT